MNVGAKAWSRRFTVAGTAFLVAWLAASLAGAPARALTTLALFGFVLHVVFGKAYLLVPSFFGRALAPGPTPGVHLVASVGGALLLAGADAGLGTAAGAVGATLWCLGVLLFLAELARTVGDAVLATRHDGPRLPRSTERLALWTLPLGFAALVAGSYATLARFTAAPALVDGFPPRATHLLAAGVAALFVFAFGVRLLPGFLGGDAPPASRLLLAAGGVGPVALAATFGTDWFRVAAAVEAGALVGYALLVGVLVRRATRRRIGVFGVAVAAGWGVVVAAFGVRFALVGWTPTLASVHATVALAGFLGTTVVGFTFLFYPPSAGRFRGASDRGAALTIALFTLGLAVDASGTLGGWTGVAATGRILLLVGAAGYAYLLDQVLFDVRAR